MGRRCADCGTVLWPILTGAVQRDGLTLGRACPRCDRMDCWPTVRPELAGKAPGPYNWATDEGYEGT